MKHAAKVRLLIFFHNCYIKLILLIFTAELCCGAGSECCPATDGEGALCCEPDEECCDGLCCIGDQEFCCPGVRGFESKQLKHVLFTHFLILFLFSIYLLFK